MAGSDQRAHILVADVGTGEQQTIPWGEAEQLEPSDPDRELFVFKRTVDDDDYRISLHPFDAPASPVARVTVSANGGAAFEGLREAWDRAPRFFYYYFGSAPGYGEETLIVLEPGPGTVQLQKLRLAERWPNGAGAIGVVQIPGSEKVVVSLHKDTSDARPIIYDPKKQAVVGRVPLADTRFGYGQSNPQFLRTRQEAWLKDYAIMQRHRLPSWEIAEALRLQSVNVWIGGSSFNHSESLCAVARPYSGDVLGIDVDSFQVSHRASMGGEPLDVVLLSDGRIFTLEWHSQELRAGRLEPWQPDEEFRRAL